jgi:hypothetical protein
LGNALRFGIAPRFGPLTLNNPVSLAIFSF